jgi:hypothetical protein
MIYAFSEVENGVAGRCSAFVIRLLRVTDFGLDGLGT